MKDTFMNAGQSNVFPRAMSESLPVIASAEGVWITDTQGRRYLDASGGPLVVNVGHTRPEILQAINNHMSKYYYAHPTMFLSEIVEELASFLADHSPSNISRFYFLSGGGEAIEASIKLARQIHLSYGKPHKHVTISRWKSYHGLSFGALSVSGRSNFKTPFSPMFLEAPHIAPPYCLRCFYSLKYPECGLRCATALKDLIENIGPEIVSSFIAETVSGASLAVVPPPEDYWKIIREICDRYEVILIQDEIMCGLGRTGKWFASEHYAIEPDILVLGKGLSGGSVALSALGIKEELFQTVKESGGFVHGGTYSHHPVAASAGLATMNVIESEGLVERSAKVGKKLGLMLSNRLMGHPNIAEIRGLGMFWGIEFVENLATLKPYPREFKFADKLCNNMFSKGVIVYKSTGLAGLDGDGIVIAPPFTVNENELNIIVETLVDSLEDV